MPVRPAAEGDRTEADELLTLVAEGCRKAFEELYELVFGPVFELVRRVVRDPAQSEEVAQEVLLELTVRRAVRPGSRTRGDPDAGRAGLRVGPGT
ncbi:hypothetical protein GCM10022384_48370 [Streptomyces marokkonensis]|uniref:Uncharacterized protein n=1 Tax=Streptomyces marokkonensis TaxID=324855 RepID=A0ABP7RBQ9_9ACTN